MGHVTTFLAQTTGKTHRFQSCHVHEAIRSGRDSETDPRMVKIRLDGAGKHATWAVRPSLTSGHYIWLLETYQTTLVMLSGWETHTSHYQVTLHVTRPDVIIH